jgi:hypothetical protein
MKSFLSAIFSLFITLQAVPALEPAYPVLYVPGMFDNGDLAVPGSKLVTQIDSPGAFFDQHYFKNQYEYSGEPLFCGSSLTPKYRRFIVANLIADYRTNISVRLMGERLFLLMQGHAPSGKSETILRNYRGNDFEGTCQREGKTIRFKGVAEELWAKYGRKVYIRPEGNAWRTVIHPDQEYRFYTNPEGYFNRPDEIGINFLTHSSGGLALRYYLALCRREGRDPHIRGMINLAVPQKGARMTLKLNEAFQKLLKASAASFMDHPDGEVTITDIGQNQYTYSYSDLKQRTRIAWLHGDQPSSVMMRNLVASYILYQVAFDGRRRVLGTDPALYDLNPRHRFIRELNREPLPEGIPVIQFYGRSAHAPLFQSIGSYLSLDENDGVVDSRDIRLTHLPGSDSLRIREISAENVNHIPFPYIKPLYHLPETVHQYYGFLRILLKKSEGRQADERMIQAVLEAVMRETGFELNQLLKSENYSIIDYFADHPVLFNGD